MGDKVQQLSRTDLTLQTLFDHYDPQRTTLRVAGASFDEVMMPSEVKYHLGAYRRDTRQIYRNLYYHYKGRDLRDLLVHEFAHHIWFNVMKEKQQEQWRQYLALHPSPLQDRVRRIYRPDEYDTEDFAYVMQSPRTGDIEELAVLKLITEEERDDILAQMAKDQDADAPESAALPAGPPQPDTPPQVAKKGTPEK